MTEPPEKIIQYDSFDSVINANIVKTKLDAYGIPCFLTGENLSNLYPQLKNDLFPGVRLYIFEKDLGEVRNILVEEQIPDSELTRCPRCGSKNVTIEDTKHGRNFRLLIALLIMFLPAKQVYHCRDCDNEFNI